MTITEKLENLTVNVPNVDNPLYKGTLKITVIIHLLNVKSVDGLRVMGLVK